MAGRGLGALTLDLVVKMGGWTAGLDKAGRELDAKTKRMEKRAYEFGRAIGTSLKVGASLAAAGLAIYIKNTIEAEKVQAQLVARLKDTGQSAGRTLAQLNAQAAKLQNLTVFDDESIGQAQAALLTFKQITGLNFDRTIEAATDLATVMGTDVADAAKLLGKALSDPLAGLGALRKAGVVLTEDQKSLVKSMQEAGDVAGAQRVILDALAGTMGSAAEAARDTLGGALQALTNAFNNLLEGNGNDDGVRGAKEAIDQLTDTLNSPQIQAGMSALITGFATVAEKAAVTAAAIANLVAGVDAFGRSAAQVNYDEGLKQEEVLKGYIKNGIGPFDPNFGMTRAEAERRLKAIQAQNAAYRNRDQGPAAPAARGGEPLDATIVVHGGEGFGKGSGSKARAVKSEAEQATEALKRMNEQMAETIALYNQKSEVEKATYAIEHGEYQKASQEQKDLYLAKAQALDQLAAEKRAREEAIRLEEEEREAAERHSKAVKDLLEDIKFETYLTSLSNEEKEKAIALRQVNADAASAEGQAILQSIDALQKAREYHERLTSAMDDFRSSFQDNVTDVLTGSKSIIDAFKDMADQIAQIISRLIAQQLSQSLFGMPGSTGGGSAGGWLSSLFGAFLGGGPSNAPSLGGGASGLLGFASGGNPPVGTPYLVGEHGPELRVDRTASTIIPTGKFGGGVSITINGNTTKDTVQYTANRFAREVARSGRG